MGEGSGLLVNGGGVDDAGEEELEEAAFREGINEDATQFAHLAPMGDQLGVGINFNGLLVFQDLTSLLSPPEEYVQQWLTALRLFLQRQFEHDHLAVRSECLEVLKAQIIKLSDVSLIPYHLFCCESPVEQDEVSHEFIGS
jgi:hypothetical protein